MLAQSMLFPLNRPLRCLIPCVTCPWCPADIECPTGVLLLKVIEATKVPKMDLFSRSSPFVE
jgi:hypothetical protein